MCPSACLFEELRWISGDSEGTHSLWHTVGLLSVHVSLLKEALKSWIILQIWWVMGVMMHGIVVECIKEKCFWVVRKCFFFFRVCVSIAQVNGEALKLISVGLSLLLLVWDPHWVKTGNNTLVTWKSINNVPGVCCLVFSLMPRKCCWTKLFWNVSSRTHRW